MYSEWTQNIHPVASHLRLLKCNPHFSFSRLILFPHCTCNSQSCVTLKRCIHSIHHSMRPENQVWYSQGYSNSEQNMSARTSVTHATNKMKIFTFNIRCCSQITAPFGDAYEKIGTIQRRLGWPLHKDDTLF